MRSKTVTLYSSVTSPSAGRFAKFFQLQTPQKVCNKVLVTNPALSVLLLYPMTNSVKVFHPTRPISESFFTANLLTYY